MLRSLLLLLAILSASAFAERQPFPRTASFCAALLSHPEFESLSTKQSTNETMAKILKSLGATDESLFMQPDLDHPDAGLLPMLREQGIKVSTIELRREYVGEQNIRQFLMSVSAASGELETAMENPWTAESKFWDAKRVRSALAHALGATVLTGAAATYWAQFFAQGPFESLHFPTLPAIATIGAFYGTWALWKKSYGYLRALKSRDKQVDMLNDETDRTMDTFVYLSNVAESADDNSFDVATLGPRIVLTVPADFAQLLLEPPRANANPTEAKNYEALLKVALARALNSKLKFYNPEGRILTVDFAYLVEKNGEPHLIVRIRVINPLDGFTPRRPPQKRKKEAKLPNMLPVPSY